VVTARRPENQLRYKDSAGILKELPAWARYLAEIGRFVAEGGRPGERIVVGVTVPTRSFAAAMVALGVASTTYRDPSDRDIERHFDELAALEPGTPIRFRRGRYLYCGKFVGTEVIGGVPHLTYRENGLCKLRWDMCFGVEPLEPDAEFVKRRPLAANAEFVEAALGVDALNHASVTEIDCLVVAVKESLRAELTETEFFAGGDRAGLVAGVLNDLLRCDAYEKNANDHDRTKVLAASNSEIPVAMRSAQPPAVVFDGPRGYLRLRNTWRSSPSVVLLDRTASASIEACETLNQDLALSAGLADITRLGPPPEPFEVTAYVERLR